MTSGLRGDIPSDYTVHLCVDMQRLFAEDTPWRMSWMPRVTPVVLRISRCYASRTVFTRFIPPRRAEDMVGQWRVYYRRWEEITRERLAPGLIDLIEPMAALVPPARLCDKAVYSPFATPQLHQMLQLDGIGAVVITGGETDVCVLATVLGAIDHGYRVILVRDGLCSGSDETHEAMMRIYKDRFSQQIEVCESEELLEAWRAA